MKSITLLLFSISLLFFVSSCTQQALEPSVINDLPVKTIGWAYDEDGFRQYYTNDIVKFNRDDQHLSFFDATMDTLELQVKKNSGYEHQGFGVIFCYRDYNNWYKLLITINGYYRISKKVNGVYSYYYNDGEGWVASSNRNWPYNEFLRTGYGKTNDIKIKRIAGEFQFVFNGQEVFSFQDSSFSGGAAGCILAIGNSDQEKFPDSPVDIRYKMLSYKPVNTVYWQNDADGYIQYCTNDSRWYGTYGVKTLGSSHTPMNSVEFEIKKVGGNSGVGYGIGFCYQDEKNFYELIHVINGYYRIGKHVDGKTTYFINNEWTEVNGQWPYTSNIKIGFGIANKVKVERDSNGTFSISYNGIQTAMFTDTTFSGGDCGYFYSVASQSYEGFPGNPEDIRYKFIGAN